MLPLLNKSFVITIIIIFIVIIKNDIIPGQILEIFRKFRIYEDEVRRDFLIAHICIVPIVLNILMHDYK